jgi:hypothetical protein
VRMRRTMRSATSGKTRKLNKSFPEVPLTRHV